MCHVWIVILYYTDTIRNYVAKKSGSTPRDKQLASSCRNGNARQKGEIMYSQLLAKMKFSKAPDHAELLF